MQGKNVVITGCLQGIGRETLKTFAENGANVFACAYEETEEFTDYCRNLSKINNCLIYPLYFDMAKDEEVKEAAKLIQAEKVEIHALVNIAGINRDALFSMVTKGDMELTFQVNFFSQMLFSQYISKLMIRKKTAGSIVFTSSTAALDGVSGQTAYASSKAALLGAMRCMAVELGKNGIRVNAVAPGVIKSPMTDQLSDEVLAERTEKINLRRIGTAKEVAKTYLFLASDLSSHVTGQVIRIDGGTR